MEEKLFIVFEQDFDGIYGMNQASGKSLDISNLPAEYIQLNILPRLQPKNAKIVPMIVFDTAMHR